jgi:tetratricopeptide (TPR) repeat protein
MEEARKEKKWEEVKKYKKALVRLYVYHGEHFKLSDQPDYISAKQCLEKALQLDPDHPLANYRYAHLMYRDQEYENAAFHFRKSLEGTAEERLSAPRALVARMMLVNCGVLAAKTALLEVRDMDHHDFRESDLKLIETYSEKMLVHDIELLEQHLYYRITPEGEYPVSRDEFEDYPDRAGDNEVLLIADREYEIMFRGRSHRLGHPAFCLCWILIRADRYLGTDDIAFALGDGGMGLYLRDDYIRQLLSRLNRGIPFWNEIMDTKEERGRILRKRKEGIGYSLLCHSSMVFPNLM